MSITLEEKDAALIIQSIEAMDWSYCGEQERAAAIVRLLYEGIARDRKQASGDRR